jgi:hypothetical protein
MIKLHGWVQNEIPDHELDDPKFEACLCRSKDGRFLHIKLSCFCADLQILLLL